MAGTEFLYITSLVTLSLMSYGVPAQQCVTQTSIYGMMLKQHVFKKIMTTNWAARAFDCVKACNNDITCQSFNYVISQEMCELNNRTKEARPEDFVGDPDRFYYGRHKNRVALGSIPELPADSCKEIKASEGVEAVSGKYWFYSISPQASVLAYCDMDTEDIDECSASIDVCGANAICENTLGSYLCHCKAGFTGNGCTEPLVTATSTCPNLLLEQTSTSGIILSTNNSDYDYNSNSNYYYDNDMDCHWNLTSSTKVELTFFTFNTELDGDYLYVYDGGSSSSPLIDSFSGTSLPSPITSSSNKLHVRFTSNNSVQRRGFRASYRGVTNGTIRLMDSETPLTGRVEIFHSNQWGTICSDGWDINDAHIVCKQLGFPQATQAFGGASYGEGSGPIWMAGVACTGSESFLYECSHGGWGNNNCTHRNDASVQCSFGMSSVRLVDGGASHGRVEVYYNETWGTVCDDYWHISDPSVLCDQLGFSGALSAPCCAAYGEGIDPIWLDDVQCQGGEASLLDCRHNDWGSHNCGHEEDASIVCYK